MNEGESDNFVETLSPLGFSEKTDVCQLGPRAHTGPAGDRKRELGDEASSLVGSEPRDQALSGLAG